ncbi:MAG: leucyl/phenylalanyl-tRNA--protein transferase [Chitinophagales bacterium]
MPIYALDKTYLAFPPPNMAEDDGMLAIGGDLSSERLLLAYSMGIFPWFSEYEPILWWSPDPRCVLYPEDLKVSKSMKQVFRKETFTITADQDFRSVITACQQQPRRGQDGTWITSEMLEAYCKLHEMGFAHSIEVWNTQQELVGGLYGISLGGAYFGESMFTYQSNASKAGFITLVYNLQKWGFNLIDCQIHTDHLESLGAIDIPRKAYLDLLNESLTSESVRGKWTLEAISF